MDESSRTSTLERARGDGRDRPSDRRPGSADDHRDDGPDNRPDNRRGQSRTHTVIYLLIGSVFVLGSIVLALYAASVQAQADLIKVAQIPASWTFWLPIFIVLAVFATLSMLVSRSRAQQAANDHSGSPPAQCLSMPQSVQAGSAPAARHQGISESIPGYAEFCMALQRHWQNGLRQSSYLAMAFVEVDDYRSLTDAFGHHRFRSRDDSMAWSLNSLVEAQGGVFARHMDGQFVALLPNTTPDDALRMAEDMRMAVEDLGFDLPSPSRGVVTSSVGICIAVPAEVLRRETLIAAAARALDQARSRGGNRVESELLDRDQGYRA